MAKRGLGAVVAIAVLAAGCGGQADNDTQTEAPTGWTPQRVANELERVEHLNYERKPKVSAHCFGYDDAGRRFQCNADLRYPGRVFRGVFYSAECDSTACRFEPNPPLE